MALTTSLGNNLLAIGDNSVAFGTCMLGASFGQVKSAARFLERWHRRLKRTRLEHMKRAADTIEARKEGILNYFIHRITNALAEGFDSRIQQLKAAARGFRSFANHRARILFFLGALNLAPSATH